MQTIFLPPEKTQELIAQIRVRFDSYVDMAKAIGCTPAAITKWRKQGITEDRYFSLKGRFPKLPFWSQNEA